MKQFFFVLGIFFAFGVHAETLSVSYIGKGAGLRLLDGQMRLDQTDSRYQMTSTGQPRGVLGLLVGGKTVFETSGQVVDQVLKPNMFSMQSSARSRRVDFETDQNILDYQSALLQMLMLKSPETRQFVIDDGRRKMNLSFTYRGKQEIKLESHHIECDYYDVTLKIISGKKGGWFFNRMGNQDDPPLRFYMGTDPETRKYLLLRAEFDTALFGTISVERSVQEE